MGATPILLIVIAFIAFIAVTARSVRGSRPPAGEAQLLALCKRDPERAERLIELELRSAPDLTRAQAVRRAIDRYLQDNR